MTTSGPGEQWLGYKTILDAQGIAHRGLKILLHLSDGCHGLKLRPGALPVNNATEAKRRNFCRRDELPARLSY